MKALLFFGMLMLWGILLAQDVLPELSIPKPGGVTKVTNAKVVKQEPDGLRVMHDAGMVKVPYEHIPEAWRSRYAFDPATAKAFREKNGAQQTQALQNIEADKATERKRMIGDAPSSQPSGNAILDALRAKRDDLLAKEEKRKAEIAAAGPITTTYDKFHAVTTLKLTEPIVLDEGQKLKAYIAISDGSPDEPSLYLTWTRVGDSWSWLKYQDVVVLLDGSRTEAEGKISTDVFSGGQVYEAVTTSPTLSQLRQIVDAKSAEMKAGTREYKLTRDQQDLLGKLLDTWQSKRPGVRAPAGNRIAARIQAG